MSLTATLTEFGIDEILDTYAYIDAVQEIPDDVLRTCLIILTDKPDSWDLNQLVDQVRERAEILKGAL